MRAIGVHHLLFGQSSLTAVGPAQSFIADPNVLFIVFGLAAVCLFLELSHPGAIVPGTVGAIALIIFLFAAASLNPNWAGLILMVLAVLLLAIDVRLPTHGIAAVAGLASLVIGSLIFFNTGGGPQASSVSIYMVLGVAVGMGLVALAVIRYAVMARHVPVISGTDGLLGQTGQVTVALKPEGRVKVLGEDWAAELAPEVADLVMTVSADQEVRVTAYDGLKLVVEPVPPAHEDILDLLLRRLIVKPGDKPASPGGVIEDGSSSEQITDLQQDQ
jgi:membrane-bound serine protease (ClpP class)